MNRFGPRRDSTDGTPRARLELAIIIIRHDDAREQVLDNGKKQRNIIREEFREIRIPESSDEHQVLGNVRIGPLEPSGHHEHTFHGSEPVVVVRLLTELFAT